MNSFLCSFLHLFSSKLGYYFDFIQYPKYYSVVLFYDLIYVEQISSSILLAYTSSK